MIFQRRGFKRFLALFFLAIFVFQIGFPVAAYALTAGPKTPETGSFEPVDTTDMVNPQTGDFTYNIPLLDVPGPEGGYPLALSYHADINPNEEASWVGLGWNLNPGAITRSVNGYPDDWNNASQSKRDYWDGVARTTYSIGVSVGIAGTPINVGFGLAFSNDTEKGYGVGVDAGAGFYQNGVSVGLTYSNDGYGEENFDAGITIMGMTRVGIDKNGGYASTKLASVGILDVNLSTRGGVSLGLSGSTSVGSGSASIHNSRAGNISTVSKGFNLSIPVYYLLNVNLGYSYYRVWSDETEVVSTYGSLYTNNGGSSTWDYNTTAFDSYSLLDHPTFNMASNSDPSELLGGSYPDLDNYMVTAQGVTGAIRPYFFKGSVLSQNRRDANGNYLTRYYQMNGAWPNPVANFRFVNDFSNSYRQNYPNFDFTPLNLPAPYDPNPVYGNGDGNTGYLAASNRLAGSKHVDYYTNRSIVNGTAQAAGFINCESYTKGFTRTNDDLIGGFSVTNEQGVTYHYALPAYNKNEYIYQEKIDAARGDGNASSWNLLTKTPPYAYAWQLTAITGPDYVERDGNGIPSDGDWGYWIRFEYGKFTDSYIWRNPSEGFVRDIDYNFQNYAKGMKEVYYLNAISSRTHTALFEKVPRKDGRGEASPVINNGNNQGAFDISTSKVSLALKRIYLLNKADAANVSTAAGTSYSGHFWENVLNDEDLTNVRSNLETKAIKILEFNQDYALCDQTPNSLTGEFVFPLTGKLTLKSLVSRGKGGVQSLPPTTFNYELSEAEQRKSGSILNPGSNPGSPTNIVMPAGSAAYQVGDLLQISTILERYTARVTAVNSPNNYTVSYIGKTLSANSTIVSVNITKNPSYQKDAYDNWGNYKSDYDGSSKDNENLRRTTSPLSAKDADAWSLRSIGTPLGATVNIDYEPDSYSKNVLNGNGSLLMSSIAFDQVNKIITCNVNTLNYPLSSFFKVGDQIDVMMSQYVTPVQKSLSDPACLSAPWPASFFVTINSKVIGVKPVVTEIDEVNKKIKFTYPGGIFIGNQTIDNCFDYKYPAPSVGNLFTYNNRETFGGGIRVKSLTITDDISGTFSRTNYGYNKPGQQISSGVTAYDPVVLDVSGAIDTKFKENLYQDVNRMLTMARELPPPGVIYEYVTVNSQKGKNTEVYNNPGKVVYQYQVFSKNMIDIIEVSRTYGTVAGKQTDARNVALKNYCTRIGNLKRIISYDDKGNKLGETIYDYLDSGMEDLSMADFVTQYDAKLAGIAYQGVVKERFAQLKERNNKYMVMMSAREEYPNVTMGETHIDYKTNVKTTSRNIGFDFYSGAITKKLETDAYGNSFLTEVIPAYRKYPAMGLKQGAAGNKNMLTQIAGSSVYKVDANNNKLALVGASAQTWSNSIPAVLPDNIGNTVLQNGSITANGNVWRAQSSYSWMKPGISADGLTPLNQFTDFNWTNPAAADASWKKANENMLVDVYSHSLMEKDMNNNYKATKLGYNNSQVITTGTFTKYNELSFSGAEDALVNGYFSGWISPGSGTVVTDVVSPTANAHTGYSSLKTGSGLAGFNTSVTLTAAEAGKSYVSSVWVKSSTAVAPVASIYYQVNGGAIVSGNVVATRKAGDWYQLNIVTPASAAVSGATIVFGCKNNGTTDVYFDDFRVRPANANTSAYVYDKQTWAPTYMLDNNNLFVRYEYDASGRVIATYRETFGNGVFKTNETQYKYKQSL